MDIVNKSQELYEAKKYLVGELNSKGGNTAYRFEGLVQSASGEILLFKGVHRLSDNDIKLELLYRKIFPIRKYHSHYNHHNPGGQLVDGPHKHFPTETSQKDCQFAYKVDDIPEDGDINDVIHAFLKESNIEVLGSGLQSVIV